jgi:hypothetical protein
MDLETLPAVLQMLQRIQALSNDPDAAELVHDATNLVSTLQPIVQLHQAAQANTTPENSAFSNGMVAVSLMMLMQQLGEESNRTPALSERSLSKLPTRSLSKTDIHELTESCGEAICAVCHENYEVGKQVMELPCGHQFCVGCGRQWLRRNCTCPVCRSEVPEDESARGTSDSNGWHSEELFPYRYPQGSSLTAVRRVRESQQAGMELWPPIEDMTLIAGQHSDWQSATGQRRIESTEDSRVNQTSSSMSGFNMWRSRTFDSSSSHQRDASPDAPHDGITRRVQSQQDTSSSLVAADAARRTLSFSQRQREIRRVSPQIDEVHEADDSDELDIPTPTAAGASSCSQPAVSNGRSSQAPSNGQSVTNSGTRSRWSSNGAQPRTSAPPQSNSLPSITHGTRSSSGSTATRSTQGRRSSGGGSQRSTASMTSGRAQVILGRGR